jgi:hypothetical protein
MATNYSLYAIPAFWVVALFPHGYAVRSSHPPSRSDMLNHQQANLIKKNNNNNWDNCNPRSTATTTSYQKTVPAECYAKFERAEAAHKNSMENAPFFMGAVLAGNMVGLSACTSVSMNPNVESVANEASSDYECSLSGVCCAEGGVCGVVYQDDRAQDVVFEERDVGHVGAGVDGHVCNGGEEVGCCDGGILR